MPTDDLEDKQARNREQRLAWIDQYTEFVAAAEDDRVWDDQINALIDAQIEAVQSLGDDLLVEVLS